MAEQHDTIDTEIEQQRTNELQQEMQEQDTDEHTTKDQEAWYQNVETKLDAIPNSSDRYTPTCEAIHQIQDLFHEVVDKQHEASSRSDVSISFDSLLGPLSVKQETLFTALVHFNQIKLTALEQTVEEAATKIEQELQIEGLEEYKTKLKECEKDLHELVESPRPVLLQSLTAATVEQTQQEDQGLSPIPSPVISPTEPTAVYSQLSALCNKAELLFLRCQELVERFDSKMDQLKSELSTKNERFLHELDEVEEWLNMAYHLLRQEPSRVLEGDEMADDGRERLESDASLQFSDPGDLLDSGSFGSGVDPHDVVDVTLEDEQYDQEVLKRVISPEADQEDELSVLLSVQQRPGSRESSVDPPSPPAVSEDATQPVQPGDLPVGGPLEDDSDTAVESGSGISGSTLRADQTDKQTGDKGVNVEKTTSTSDEGVNDQNEDEVTVTFTFGGEQGVNKQMGPEDSQEEEEVQSQDEELSSEGDKFGLHWIRELQLLPMEHDPAIDEDYQGEIPQPEQSTKNDIYHLLGQLEDVQNDLKIQSQKMKSTTANIRYVINHVSMEMGRALDERLQSVKQRWENLPNRLNLRRAQLTFEKAQREILDSVLEATRELDDQPQSNLLPEELEKKKNLLIDFLISLDQFDSQKTEQLSNLDQSLDDLEGVWPEEEGLQEWKDTVEQLRAAYEAIAEKVKEQVTFLESCLSMWSNFSGRCKKFEEWLSRSEEMVNRDTYGDTLQECEVYHTALKKMKAKFEEKELAFTEIVKLGNAMLEDMEEQSEAEQFIDDKLSTLEQRWFDLVSQNTGSLDVRESAVKTVVTKWKGYTGQYTGTQMFITQMIKIVGPEPLESSDGNQTLLSTYRTYAEQLKRMEVQYNRLMDAGSELVTNEMVGGRVAIREEMDALRMKWGPLKDNITDSLDLLIREYNDWIMMKLKQMDSLVCEAAGLVKKEVEFVEGFPLEDLLDQDAGELLKEYETLVASQERINQMDVDCTHIEEKILERQIQQETSTEEGEVSSESLEYSSTANEKQRLNEEREKIMMLSDSLQPVLNVFGLQLQLVHNIQEDTKVVTMAIDFVGEKEELEELLEDVQIKLSDDHFDQLRSDAYDLGTVLEESQEILETITAFNIPSYDKLVALNRSLTAEVDVLGDSANAAFVRLQLFIEWWVEYRSNYGDIIPWLEGAESHLNQIILRCENTQPPLVAPTDLLQEAQELQTEVEDKSRVVSAMASTAKNILEEMESKGSPPGEIADQMADVQLKWESLKLKLEAKKEEFSSTANRFNSFLDSFGTFVNWLSEFYGMLYDEVCVQIPTRASDDTIAHHRAQLEEFHKETLSHVAEYESLVIESTTWANHLIPEDSLADLPSPSEPSPPPFSDDDNEFPPPSQLSYVYRRMSWATEKWSRLQHLLQERDSQLEMSSGSLQEFSEALQNLLNWLNEELRRDSLVGVPPADIEQLKTYKQELQVTSDELVERKRVLESLVTSAMTLKTQVAAPNASRLDERLSQVAELWETLDKKIKTRQDVLDPLISRVESLCSRFNDFDSWLTEQENVLKECGPIGANLERLKEQTEILELQDGVLLEKKCVPEDLNKELMNLIEQSLEGSGTDTQKKCEELESRFTELCQQSVERKELCEEALSAMQEFQKKVDKFTSWLEEMEKSLADKRAEKKPIGTIQTELEEFYDYMSDIERHTEEYQNLYAEAKQLSNAYKPSDVLDEMMSSLHNRWCAYVNDLSERSDELLGLADLWRRYETEVKELLNWVSTEANGFSKEVTTEGDKGIEDHIESCKVFSGTLEAKRHAILEVEDLANILRAEDGEKKNGTSDVESRWNDVNQHWNSLCKLLAETLLRLEATYAEVRHVIQIRTEEFDWLNECEHRGNAYRPTRGNLDAVQEEIKDHQQLLEEVISHYEEAEFVKKTIPFLVEHSRKQVRDEMKEKADDFIKRYETLKHSQDSYVQNLQDSIPHWKQFNEEVYELQQWVEQVNRDLESDKFQPGNATMTETSLTNARRVLEETSVQSEAVQLATNTSEALSKLVIASDVEYVNGIMEELSVGTEHISEEITARTSDLEERLKSWQVFPVEEARVVQDFLDQVESEVTEEKTAEEEMTSDQLLEKLKRLEALQEMQSTNEDKVSSIDKSAESEDVKKALEKNPDISKERTNLLQGWSTMSSSLKVKIAVMKQKTKMVEEIEQSLSECENALRAYKTHLNVPLPPSVVLVGINKKLKAECTTLHNRCQSCLSNQQNLFDKYSVDPDLPIPVHLCERSRCCLEEFQTLSTRSQQRTNQIEEITESWLKFEQGMKNFSSWLRTCNSELSGLRVVENFVLEFSSLEDRLEMLTDEVSEREDDFDALKTASFQHCCGEGDDVQQVKQMFTKVEQSWCSLKEGVKTLPATIKPWKELTDQFEQLTNWFDLLEHRVEQDKATIEERDDNGGSVSDLVVAFKSHLDKLSQQEPELQELQDRANDLLTEKAYVKFKSSVGELREQCDTLDRKWEELRNQLDQTLSQLEKKSEQWNTQALRNRSLVTELQLELAASQEESRQREHTIVDLRAELKNRPYLEGHAPPKRGVFLELILFIAMVIILLLLVRIFNFPQDSWVLSPIISFRNPAEHPV